MSTDFWSPSDLTFEEEQYRSLFFSCNPELYMPRS